MDIINKIKSERLQEEYLKIKHKSGLEILLYPKPEYSSACVMFGAKFGSIDNSFKLKNEPEFIHVPNGTAHYLEHKLFESEEKDAFNLFAQTGASANAYTSFDRTAYYFSTTKNFGESLKILLDFVLTPYFTDKNVQKERGIIGQEIKMYDDDPSWQVTFNCLNAMYHNNPVKTDIAGDIESINEITKEKLYQCYNAFYNMNNMTLTASGNFDVQEFMDIVNSKIKDGEKTEIERKSYNEPETVVQNETETKLSVVLPQFCFGIKLPAQDGREKLKADIEYNLINEMLIGDASDLYSDFYESGLVPAGEVAAEVFSGRGYYSLLFEGESKNPRQAVDKIKQKIIKFQNKKSLSEEFKPAKKSIYGKTVKLFDSPDNLANLLFSSSVLGVDLYDNLELTAKVSEEDIMKRLKTIDLNHSSLSVVNPA